jgi:hypothetical protein
VIASAEKKESQKAESEPPRRLFIWRGLFGLLVPPAFAAYYICTYVQFLRPPRSRTVGADGAPVVDGTLLWWSWFVIGAVGINVSTYVLAGVEAGYLTSERLWRLNRGQAEMHKDKSWSRVSGWVNMAFHVFGKRNYGKDPVLSWLWVVLFVLQLLSWAFVLSGLTMETEASFKVGSAPGASVVGANASTFDGRSAVGVLEAAYQVWRLGQKPQMPFLGAFYSPSEPRVDFNVTTGNSLPENNKEAIFLGPRADMPLTGRAWGLALNYSCKPIYNLDDFRILNQRINSSDPRYFSGVLISPQSGQIYRDPPKSYSLPTHYFYDVPGIQGATISVVRDNSSIGLGRSGIGMVAEVGLGFGVYDMMDRHTRSYAAPYGGLAQEEVLEVALWQLQKDRRHRARGDGVQGAIPDLSDEYIDLPVELPGVDDIELPSSGRADIMKAIGVQCVSSSALGSATLDGLSGSYQDFLPEGFLYPPEPPDPRQGFSCDVPRLGLAVPAMFIPGVRASRIYDSYTGASMDVQRPQFTLLSKVLGWAPGAVDDMYLTDTNNTFFSPMPDLMMPLLAAGGVPPVTLAAPGVEAGILYTRYMEPRDLQRALERAYQHVAVQLMYGEYENHQQVWSHANLTAAVPSKRLVPAGDSVPAILVLAALVLWAVGCVALTAVFSFRRRWDAFMSTASLYWYLKACQLDPLEVMSSMER